MNEFTFKFTAFIQFRFKSTPKQPEQRVAEPNAAKHQKYKLSQIYFPSTLTEGWFKRMQYKLSILQYLCGVLSILSGLFTLVFCDQTYFVNNGIATGGFLILALSVNVMLVCAKSLSTRAIVMGYVAVNVMIVLVGGVAAIIASIIGVMCEVNGIGDAHLPSDNNGTMKWNEASNFLIGRCDSAYFGLNVCENKHSKDQGNSAVIYYIANRQNFICTHLVLGICGLVVIISSSYVAVLGCRFYPSIPPNALVKSIRTSVIKSNENNSRNPTPSPIDPSPPCEATSGNGNNSRNRTPPTIDHHVSAETVPFDSSIFTSGDVKTTIFGHQAQPSVGGATTSFPHIPLPSSVYTPTDAESFADDSRRRLD